MKKRPRPKSISHSVHWCAGNGILQIVSQLFTVYLIKTIKPTSLPHWIHWTYLLVLATCWDYHNLISEKTWGPVYLKRSCLCHYRVTVAIRLVEEGHRPWQVWLRLLCLKSENIVLSCWWRKEKSHVGIPNHIWFSSLSGHRERLSFHGQVNKVLCVTFRTKHVFAGMNFQAQSIPATMIIKGHDSSGVIPGGDHWVTSERDLDMQASL